MINIEEISLENINEFWEKHIFYLCEDKIITSDDDKAYFTSREYRGLLENHMTRPENKQHMVYFVKDGIKIGATSFCTFQSEDGKCFILDFWVFPNYRGKGTGHACFHALEEYTKKDGARYFELNSEKENSIRFWKSLGFQEFGRDEFGMPLFIRH
jgi:ribosomal protein S18 acetylase RimI-like enzyme